MRNKKQRGGTYQLSSLAFEAMVTQIHVLKEGLKQIKTWNR